MISDTIKQHRTPRPNYTPQQYSDALERAMMKRRYPTVHYHMQQREKRLKAIDNYLKIQENEYDNDRADAHHVEGSRNTSHAA